MIRFARYLLGLVALVLLAPHVEDVGGACVVLVLLFLVIPPRDA